MWMNLQSEPAENRPRADYTNLLKPPSSPHSHVCLLPPTRGSSHLPPPAAPSHPRGLRSLRRRRQSGHPPGLRRQDHGGFTWLWMKSKLQLRFIPILHGVNKTAHLWFWPSTNMDQIVLNLVPGNPEVKWHRCVSSVNAARDGMGGAISQSLTVIRDRPNSISTDGHGPSSNGVHNPGSPSAGGTAAAIRLPA